MTPPGQGQAKGGVRIPSGITERKKVEQALGEATKQAEADSRAKSQFLVHKMSCRACCASRWQRKRTGIFGVSRLTKMMVVCVTLGALGLSGCYQTIRLWPRAVQWPEGKSPREVGQRVSEQVLPRLHIENKGAHGSRDIMWVSMVRYAKKTEDQALLDSVIGQFDPMLTSEGEALISDKRHVDHSIFGTVPLELYTQTQDPRYLAMGQTLADRQWESPDANGLSGETRFWVDDMYMITALQVQAFHATGDPVYLDRAALQMVAYLNKLQRPNGLFYHGPDAPFFWGRGNGWAAAGMVELLSVLPKRHARYAHILGSYRKMMVSLLSYQDDDGMWHQLIDYKKSYRESSCTAMFTYAMIQGVKHEWLSVDDYGLAARNGWLKLVDMVDEQGRLEGVCVGTGKRTSLAHYLDRPRQAGDPHGQAPMLWCILSLL